MWYAYAYAHLFIDQMNPKWNNFIKTKFDFHLVLIYLSRAQYSISIFLQSFHFYFLRCLIAVPNGPLPFRTMGISQRPFLDTPFTSHLRDLDFRRKAPPLTAITTSINNTSTMHVPSNGLSSSSSDCQGYKPNAPQIQGKIPSLCLGFGFVFLTGNR